MVSGLSPGAHIDLTLDPTASGTGMAVYSVSIRVIEDGVVEALAVGRGADPSDVARRLSALALSWPAAGGPEQQDPPIP